MNEVRRFIEVDNHEAVKIGELQKNVEAIKVVRPMFNRMISPTDASSGRGTVAHLHRHSQCGACGWGQQVADEDWHAICQAICRGIEGAEWENLHYKFVEMNNEAFAAQVEAAGQTCSGHDHDTD